jgi:hypothetical protein
MALTTHYDNANYYLNLHIPLYLLDNTTLLSPSFDKGKKTPARIGVRAGGQVDTLYVTGTPTLLP